MTIFHTSIYKFIWFYMQYFGRILSRKRRLMGTRLGWDNNIKLGLTELWRKGINWTQATQKN
jgi:hypothetical protein